jgi:predicted nucleotidyltransferase
VKIKKYFYVLRPVLACDWIENEKSFPPMEFDRLVESQVKDADVRSAIDNLLVRKMAGEELREEPRIDVLNDLLAEKIKYFSDFVGEIDTVDKPQTEMLDELFCSTLREVWN